MTDATQIINVISAQPGWSALIEIENVVPDFRPEPVLGWIVMQDNGGIKAHPLLVSGMIKNARYIQRPDGRIMDVGNAVFSNLNDLIEAIQKQPQK
ncbi:hypothetical protein [uncultured Desulfobacter sp.]|uniref:hypothetical protein n=1 Tax=uncultured Desulfobacter sp. TaxID=240139 RepID=UPI002AAABBD0|nr:hypothetical protein [uncultured Desulfobacter sp.]